MTDVLAQTSSILQQSGELIKNPAIRGIVTGFIGFLKNAFVNKKKAQQWIEMVEKQEATDSEIIKLEGALEELLDENSDLKAKFEEQLKKVNDATQAAGMTITKNNSIKNSGNGNINIQDISNHSGDINIGK